MEKYFEKKLADIVTKKVKTGERAFNKIYERDYDFEILKVENDYLIVEVNSKDLNSSGYVICGTDRYLGECKMKIGNKSKHKILSKIIEKCDSKFVEKYKIKLV